MFGLNRKCFTFDLNGACYSLEVYVKDEGWFYFVKRGEALVYEEKRTARVSESCIPYEFHADLPEASLKFVVGAIGLTSLGLEVYRGDALYWRSSDKPFSTPKWTQGFLEWLDCQNEKSDPPKTPEQLKLNEDAKQLQPAIAVDIALGVLFFFVAREYGLVSAAVTGACATFGLLLVDRFVKPDLTGGFAVFGAVMALISAGLSLGLLDDLAIKLRGSIMGLILASLAFVDWLNDGRYLGRRFARYFYVLGVINPKRASLALCVSSLLLVAIDTPLAFILTTDQWIWYKAFLDSLIAIPIIFGAMWFSKAR